MKIKLACVLLSLTLIVLLWGCNSSSNNNPTGPAGGSTTETIPPGTGGTVTYSNASVNIPAGALSDTTEITVGVPQT